MKRSIGNLKWFITGFALMALIIGAVTIIPAFGQGGGGNPNNPDAGPVTDTSTIHDLSNKTQGNTETVTTESRTDDPQGRAPVDVSQNTGTVNNDSILLEEKNDGGVEPMAPDTANVIVISSADFSSDGYDPDSFFFSFWEGYLRGGNVNTCLMAPVNPPNGAKIYQLWATVNDNDPAGALSMTLFRVDNYDGSVDELAAIASGNSAILQQLSDTTIDPTLGTVIYPDYSYYIGTCISTTLIKLLSTRVWYQ